MGLSHGIAAVFINAGRPVTTEKICSLKILTNREPKVGAAPEGRRPHFGGRPKAAAPSICENGVCIGLPALIKSAAILCDKPIVDEQSKVQLERVKFSILSDNARVAEQSQV